MALENITMTKLRRLILDILLQAQEPVKAYDLLERAREKGHRLTASTIYRILDYLEASGLTHRVSSLNVFLARAEGGQAHQPLIVVCPQCQKTQEVSDEILPKSIFQRLNALGQNISIGSVAIRGLCPQRAPEI
jgi:Fur family zinc uptake transcriptional regulator